MASLPLTEHCIAPSEVLKVLLKDDPLKLFEKLAGEFAERQIELDYLKKRGGRIFADHFFDNPIGDSYIAFLAAHNAHIRNAPTLIALKTLANLPGGGIKRPDILTDKDGLKEYYEIKPDSEDGTKDGKDKLNAIASFMGTFRLPYVAGISYKPQRILLPEVHAQMAPIEPLPLAAGTRVYLSPRLTRPGLIQYLYCIETDWSIVAAHAAAWAALAALILIAILVARFKVPAPKVPPTPIPTPIPPKVPPILPPVPIPVPAL